MKSAVFTWLLSAGFLLFSFNSLLYAEDGVSSVSARAVEEKIKEINDSKQVNEETKAMLQDRYRKTLEYLEAEKENRAAAATYNRAIKKAPEQTLKIRKQLEQRADKKTTSAIARVTDKTSLTELEQLLFSEKANLAAVQSKHNELKQQLSAESNRATEIRNRLTEINQQLQKITADAELVSIDKDKALKQANDWLYQAQTAALQSEIKSLDQELLSQPVRLEHLNAEYDLSSRKLKWMSNTVTQLEDMANLKRKTQAQQAIEKTRQAKLQATGKHALIQQLAEKNERLSEKISQISDRLSALTRAEDKIDAMTKRISTEYNSTKKKLEVAGLSQELGQILLNQKNNLPDEHAFTKKAKLREHELATIGLLHLQTKDELLQMSDMDAYLEKLTQSLTQEERQLILPDLEKLSSDRKSLLKKMNAIASSYIRMLDDMSFGEKNLQEVVSRYNTLLEKQLFWMRNSAVITWKNITTIPESMLHILSRKNWLDVYNSFVSSWNNSNVRAWGYLIALILLLKTRHLKRLLIHTGTKLGKISTDKYSYTFKALFYTLILALPWPLIIAFTGQQLKRTGDPSEFTQAVAAGMIWIVMPLFYLLFFRNMCLPGGLAEVHFKWHKTIIQDLRRALGRLTITFLPALFISVVLINLGAESMHDEVARLILIITLAAFSLFFYRLFRHNKGILAPLIKQKPDSLLTRYQNVWLLMILITSLNLFILIIIGYVYTAGFLLRNLIHTVWFVFALIIVHQLILRWLLLSRRKLALKAAIERRQAALALKESEAKNAQEKQQNSIEFTEPKIDLINLSNESNKLLKVVLFLAGVFGLVGIWSEVLPALSIFDDITLWYHSGIVNGEEKILPVTLGNVGTAVLVVLLTIIAARNLPSIIELILLQQPSVSSGSRYTIKTLTNYIIIGIGTFSVFNLLGAEWSKLQWLFAALSVGIGFGLQEIVANFISGIILLFERPIRVGDYVSVGDNEGIVSNIHIRATTILTFDRKELLVPNKEFITGQLLNWSLSDPTTRIIISVGVAYGSDIPKARELLLQAAARHERVLAEPTPRVIFYGFGDNTLDMQLRCFIANVDHRLATISDLNEVINEKFNAAGISIAFPQRDVHLDLRQPVEVRLHKSMLTD